MGDTDRFYSAHFYAPSASARFRSQLERLSAVVAVLVAATVFDGGSSRDAMGVGVPERAGSSASALPASGTEAAATTVEAAAMPCRNEDPAACPSPPGTSAAVTAGTARLPVPSSPFSGR